MEHTRCGRLSNEPWTVYGYMAGEYANANIRYRPSETDKSMDEECAAQKNKHNMERVDLMRQRAKELESITVPGIKVKNMRAWWDEDQRERTGKALGEYSRRDLDAVRKCEFAIFDLDSSYNFRGTWVELGYALSNPNMLIILLLGKDDIPKNPETSTDFRRQATNAFTHHPQLLRFTGDGAFTNALEAVKLNLRNLKRPPACRLQAPHLSYLQTRTMQNTPPATDNELQHADKRTRT